MPIQRINAAPDRAGSFGLLSVALLTCCGAFAPSSGGAESADASPDKVQTDVAPSLEKERVNDASGTTADSALAADAGPVTARPCWWNEDQVPSCGAGGCLPKAIFTGEQKPQALYVGRDSLTWITAAKSPAHTRQVVVAKKDGTNRRSYALGEMKDGLIRVPEHVAVESDHVFVLSEVFAPGSATKPSWTLEKLNPDSGDLTLLSIGEGAPSGLQVNGHEILIEADQVIAIDFEGNGRRVILERPLSFPSLWGSTLWGVTYDLQKVQAARLDLTTKVLSTVNTQTAPTRVLGDSESMFWTTYEGNGGVSTINFQKPGIERRLVKANVGLYLAQDSETVFLSAYNRILAVDKDGTCPILLTDFEGTDATEVSSDGTAVFWVDTPGGRVLRFDKGSGGSPQSKPIHLIPAYPFREITQPSPVVQVASGEDAASHCKAQPDGALVATRFDINHGICSCGGGRALCSRFSLLDHVSVASFTYLDPNLPELGRPSVASIFRIAPGDDFWRFACVSSNGTFTSNNTSVRIDKKYRSPDVQICPATMNATLTEDPSVLRVSLPDGTTHTVALHPLKP